MILLTREYSRVFWLTHGRMIWIPLTSNVTRTQYSCMEILHISIVGNFQCRSSAMKISFNFIKSNEFSVYFSKTVFLYTSSSAKSRPRTLFLMLFKYLHCHYRTAIKQQTIFGTMCCAPSKSQEPKFKIIDYRKTCPPYFVQNGYY